MVMSDFSIEWLNEQMNSSECFVERVGMLNPVGNYWLHANICDAMWKLWKPT